MRYHKYTRRNLAGNRFFANLSITNWIILINVIFFVAAYAAIRFNPGIMDYIGLKPANIFQLKSLWTLITSMFMHGGLGHLVVNMISLAFIGNFVEKIIGRKRFFWFYMIAGIAAGLLFVLLAYVFQADMNVYAVGASGAIFGLGGLMMMLTPKMPVLVFFIIPLPMWIAMLFLLVILWLASWGFGLSIGNTAHLGGLLAGIIFGFYLKHKYKRKVEMLNRHFR